MATVKNLSYTQKEKAHEITHSMTYHASNTKVDKYCVNAKVDDIPALFSGMLTKN